MVDGFMKKWAAAKNLPEVGGAIMAPGVGGGVSLFYGTFPEYNGSAAGVAIEESTWNKEMLKQLKKMAKGIGTPVYRDGSLLIVVRGGTQNGRFTKLDQATDLLRTALPQLGIQPAQTCRFCHQPGCDDTVVVNGGAYPAHTVCKQQEAERVLGEVEANRENGNVLLGIIAALVGGLVGSLPTFITLYFFDIMFGYLFVLIPLGAYYGYKLAKGVMAGWVPIVICLVSIVSTVVMLFTTLYIYMAQLSAQWYGMSLQLGDFIELLPLMLSDMDAGLIFEFIGIPILFTGLGIVLTWGQISKSNKQKIQEAEALRQSIAPRM